MSADSKYRILVVDDDPDVRMVVEEILQERYEVVCAHDGLDALDKLPRYEPDFVILDMVMPLMDGMETCAAIRRTAGFNSVPVLFLSAHGSPEKIVKTYECGGNLFLAKPVDPVRLLKNVEVFFQQTPPAHRLKRMSLRQIRMIEGGKAASDRTPPGGIPRPALPPRALPEAPLPAAHFRRPALATRPVHPVRVAGAGSPPPDPSPSPSPSSSFSSLVPRILVVEDDPDLAQLLALRLMEQFEVVLAADGLSGVEKLVDYQPDLILLDIMLPKMNGYQLLESIRANRSFAQTPVIIMTAKSSDRDREYASKHGADAFLAKPFDMDALEETCLSFARRPGFRVTPKNKSVYAPQVSIDDGPRAFVRPTREDKLDAFPRRER